MREIQIDVDIAYFCEIKTKNVLLNDFDRRCFEIVGVVLCAIPKAWICEIEKIHPFKEDPERIKTREISKGPVLETWKFR